MPVVRLICVDLSLLNLSQPSVVSRLGEWSGQLFVFLSFLDPKPYMSGCSFLLGSFDNTRRAISKNSVA